MQNISSAESGVKAPNTKYLEVLWKWRAHMPKCTLVRIWMASDRWSSTCNQQQISRPVFKIMSFKTRLEGSPISTTKNLAVQPETVPYFGKARPVFSYQRSECSNIKINPWIIFIVQSFRCFFQFFGKSKTPFFYSFTLKGMFRFSSTSLAFPRICYYMHSI